MEEGLLKGMLAFRALVDSCVRCKFGLVCMKHRSAAVELINCMVPGHKVNKVIVSLFLKFQCLKFVLILYF